MLAAMSVLSHGRPHEGAVPFIAQQKVLDDTAAWQIQLVEAFGICPFARQCREEGRLWRQVVTAPDGRLDVALTEAIAALHHTPGPRDRPWEVALLLCPTGDEDAITFERLVRQTADRAEAQVRAAGIEPQFHVVAFHPAMHFAADDPQKLLGFWRRSPWPTAQLVHVATLNRLRDVRPPVRYVDPDDLAAVQALLGQSFSGDLADRITLTNWRTYHGNTAALLQKSAQLLASARNS